MIAPSEQITITTGDQQAVVVAQTAISAACVSFFLAMHRDDGCREIRRALALAHTDNIDRQLRYATEGLGRADAG